MTQAIDKRVKEGVRFGYAVSSENLSKLDKLGLFDREYRGD
ncbi:hypothetical protein ES703_72229 [subsurface metagenome]